MFPALVLAALNIWTGAAQPRTTAILPVPGEKACRLPASSLPGLLLVFSGPRPLARRRQPGSALVRKDGPGNLLDSKPNPSTAKPGDHAMFALFHLKDGNFMAVLPVAAPDSLAWLKLERDGTFLVEAGSLGTSPPNRRPSWPSPPRTKIFTAPVPPYGTRPFPSPFIKGQNLAPGKENLSGTVQVPRLVQLGTV